MSAVKQMELQQEIGEGLSWLEYKEDHQGAIVKMGKERAILLQRMGGAWITKPFNNWKKAIEKLRAHSKSEVHI